MKRIGYIFEHVVAVDNCREAIICASKDKTHSPHVAGILHNLDYFAKKLSKMLACGEFVPSEYQIEEIFDGLSKKARILHKPRFFPDQCVHWAVMLQMQPIFMKPMYKMTCGSIKNRGSLKAAKYVERWVRTDPKNTKYCLKADIRHFYQSCGHEMTKQCVRRMIKDKRMIHLFDLIIDSVDEEVGLPLGNYTSQWLGNAILTPLDHFIKEKLRVKHYVRYADDIVLLGSNKKELHRVRREIAMFLEKYGLRLKKNWQVFHVEYYNKRKGKMVGRKIDFCGYAIGRKYTRIRKRIAKRMKKVLVSLGNGKYTYSNCARFIAYNGWLKHSDSKALKKKYVYGKINMKKVKKVIADRSKEYYCTYSG